MEPTDAASVLDGYRIVDTDAHYTEPPDLWTSRVPESMREKVLARGLVTERELADLMGALERHLADPHTIVARSLLVQAWGRKPT